MYARNGVYSSCFFLSFVDSALSSVAEERESSALLHDKIALVRGKEKEKERKRKSCSTKKRNPPAHAMRARVAYIMFQRIYRCAIAEISRCRRLSVDLREIERRE